MNSAASPRSSFKQAIRTSRAALGGRDAKLIMPEKPRRKKHYELVTHVSVELAV